jgi:hypothetical protein
MSGTEGESRVSVYGGVGGDVDVDGVVVGGIGWVCHRLKMYWKGRGRRRVSKALWREEERRGRLGRRD